MKKIIIFLLVSAFLVLGILTSVAWSNPALMASVKMLWLLLFLWVGVGGITFYFLRNYFLRIYTKVHLPLWLKFTLFATIFALLEEGIAVGINNYYYPITQGVGMLTASTNYWEVVSKHSVVALLPLFLIFSFWVSRSRPKASKVFIIFGLVGLLAEASIGGGLSLLQFGLWIPVYGLMVYLPAYASQRVP